MLEDDVAFLDLENDVYASGFDYMLGVDEADTSDEEYMT